MTHARLLVGSNRTDLYDTWELWDSAGVGVDTPLRQQQHVEQVFARQTELGSPHLAPTVTINSVSGDNGRYSLEMAWIARGIDERAWQSVAGSREFWRSGVSLDAHIGSLVELRAPVWVVTVTNELVLGQTPDLADRQAYEGLLRSIHSLSERSRVIIAYADMSGLLSVGAGADTIGAGWDRAMRTFDPGSFHIDSDAGIRIPASYVTQKNLFAVLRRDAAEAIERWNVSDARRIRGRSMPTSDQIERVHHLASIGEHVATLSSIRDRAARVAALRLQYESAATDFDTLIDAIGPAVRVADKTAWVSTQLEILRAYASNEGLW